jgi:O-acetyl-ADP-ribose deacetylase (regulator of RNase III)
MIGTAKGDILKAETEALVNTVNTVGVMGKGIALQFKRAYPGNFKAYQAAVDHGEVTVGRMHVFHTGTLEWPHYIINFPTKRHWRGRSRLEDIALGLQDLRRVIVDLGIESIAVPALGCGNGGLHWPDVRRLIEEAVAGLDARIMLYPPEGAPPAERMRVGTERPRMTAGRAALIGLLGRYAEPGYGASMLEVQKLLYLLQEAGEPLRLDFVRAKYGPYSEKVNFVLQALEGHYVSGYGDRSSASTARLLPGAFKEAEVFLTKHPETRERFERVLKLIEGYESPYGLELLGTTHWAIREQPEAAADVQIAIRYVREWSHRKEKLFTPPHVERSWNRLRDLGWFRAAASNSVER